MDRYSNSYGDGMGTNSMPTTHSEIKAETEAEVETVLVLTKRLKLRTITGQITIGDLEVYECENPYLLIFLLTTEYYDGIRMDVHKDDLAKELRHWLQGKNIFNPVLFVPLKIDEAINNFVKFGKTPKQEDMIMWILSRSELYLGSESELVFGGRLIGNENSRGVGNNEEYQTLGNDMTRSMIGTKKEERIYEEDRPMKEATDESMSTSAAGPVLNSQYHNTMKTLSSASDTPSRTRPVSAGRMRPIDDPGKEMFATTKKLLGKSLTLEQLKKQKVQGRDGAAQSMSIRNWTTEQLLLCADIEKARKKIESSMDERRKAIEVVKARKIQSVERFKKIKEDFKEEHGKGKFITNARNELYGLQKMESDIRDDINRQKIRAQRDYQKMAWIKAPPGFDNLRGKSQRGPVLGKGPLPFNATSSLRDPAIEMTMKKYYWDTAGRRHAKNGNNEDEGNESLIEKAMDAIRKASSNVAAFKLDLRAVFEQFDTSGDGFLSPEEMAQGFLSMGVMLDVESMQAIFK